MTRTRPAGQDGEVAFTVFQVSLFFSIYVFFQVWNQINCRSLMPEVSGLANLRQPFLGSPHRGGRPGADRDFGGSVFKVEPLSPLAWLGVIGFTVSVLVFAEIARRIRLAAAKKPASQLS